MYIGLTRMRVCLYIYIYIYIYITERKVVFPTPLRPMRPYFILFSFFVRYTVFSFLNIHIWMYIYIRYTCVFVNIYISHLEKCCLSDSVAADESVLYTIFSVYIYLHMNVYLHMVCACVSTYIYTYLTLRNVVFPTPLRPMRPYFRPPTSVSSQSSKRERPFTSTWKETK